MFIDQLKELSEWDYCKFDLCEDEEIVYQFGWREGLHFYLSDYQTSDELGQFYLIVYLNKENIHTKCCNNIEEIITKIKDILNE